MTTGTYQTVTTNLVHRRDKTSAPWWRSAVICDLPGSMAGDDLPSMTDRLGNIADLGFTAVLVRPAGPQTIEALTELSEFIRACHSQGLQVLVRTFIPEGDQELEPTDSPPLLTLEHDTERLRTQITELLDIGADGIDLGTLDEQPGQADSRAAARAFTEGVQGLLAEVTLAGDTTVLAAEIRLEPRDAAVRHLTEEWFHHLRDDSLITSDWDSSELETRIMAAYADRDPLGQSAAWRYSLPRWSGSPQTRDSADSGWASEKNTPDRESAMMLLTLALPGAAYVPYLHVGGGVKVKKGKDAVLKFNFAKGRSAQFRARLARDAIALRHRLDLGETALASVRGLEWASDDTLVLLAGPIMVVLNTGAQPVTVPREHRLALSSDPFTQVDDAGSAVTANTCAWFHTAERHPSGPVAYR